MKKGRLSKKEKEYISKNHEKMTATIMADKMDRSVHMVDKYVEKLSLEPVVKDETDQPEKPVTETVSSAIDSSSLYVRDGNKTATIMTEAASAAGDESRKKPSTPQRYKSVIHKIKEG